MRNRKSLLGLVLLALVLVLGVGYAVVSSVTLSIDGSATVAKSTLKVSFEGTVTDGGSATKGALTAILDVKGLTKIGDTKTVTYTIQNEETDLDASVLLKGAISNSKSEFFEVTTSASSAVVVKKGSTATVTVTVKLIKAPILEEDSTTNITVTLEATPQQPTA
jgi:hypothetical protein